MSELSRLRWLCRRGMKELDVVMSGYLEKRYGCASEVDQQSFRSLLDLPDPDLFSLLMGRESASDEHIESLLNELRSLVRRF